MIISDIYKNKPDSDFLQKYSPRMSAAVSFVPNSNLAEILQMAFGLAKFLLNDETQMHYLNVMFPAELSTAPDADKFMILSPEETPTSSYEEARDLELGMFSLKKALIMNLKNAIRTLHGLDSANVFDAEALEGKGIKIEDEDKPFFTEGGALGAFCAGHISCINQCIYDGKPIIYAVYTDKKRLDVYDKYFKIGESPCAISPANEYIVFLPCNEDKTLAINTNVLINMTRVFLCAMHPFVLRMIRSKFNAVSDWAVMLAFSFPILSYVFDMYNSKIEMDDALNIYIPLIDDAGENNINIIALTEMINQISIICANVKGSPFQIISALIDDGQLVPIYANAYNTARDTISQALKKYAENQQAEKNAPTPATKPDDNNTAE